MSNNIDYQPSLVMTANGCWRGRCRRKWLTCASYAPWRLYAMCGQSIMSWATMATCAGQKIPHVVEPKLSSTARPRRASNHQTWPGSEGLLWKPSQSLLPIELTQLWAAP
jgi:hypothetical protein